MSSAKSPNVKRTAAASKAVAGAAKTVAAKPKAETVTYKEKRRLLTDRINKLRAEAEQLSINASRLLERITS